MRGLGRFTDAYTQMLMSAGEPRPDGSHWHVKCGSGLRVAQASPITKGYDLLFLGPKRAQEPQHVCHVALVVQPSSSVIYEIIGLRRRR